MVVRIRNIEARYPVFRPNIHAARLVEGVVRARTEGGNTLFGGKVVGLDLVVIRVGYIDLAIVVAYT